MTAIRTSGTPRKAPSDTVLLAALASGMSYADIGRRHGVDPTNISRHATRLGWKRKLACVVTDEGPSETSEKIVRWRNAISPGRHADIILIAISLPRIPTIHGQFTAAMPAAQGV